MGWGSLGSDKHLVEWARELRLNPTEPEKWLWRGLSNRKLGGFKFRRQATLDPFIADFFCSSRGLLVEVDGETHDPDYDSRRDAFLATKGFTTIRFTNDQVLDNMDGVLTEILQTLEALPDRWPSLRLPHPNPSPEGEGLKR